MKKTRSAKKIAMGYFALMMAVTVVGLLLCTLYSAWIYEKQLRYCNEATQTVSRNNLSSVLDGLENFNRNLCSNNADFSMLSYESSQLTVQQRMVSMQNLRWQVDNRVPDTGGIFLFNRSGSIYYYRIGNGISSGAQTAAGREFMRQLYSMLVSQPDDQMNRWQTYAGEEEDVIIVNCYRQRDLFICSFLNLDAFAGIYSAGTENVHYVFYNSDGVLTNEAFLAEQKISMEDLQQESTSRWRNIRVGNVIERDYLEEYNIGLATIMPITGIWKYSQVYLLIMAAALIAIGGAFAAAYSVFHKVLIYPLNEISVASRRLAGSEPNEDEVNTDLTELSDIRVALNQLVEQKVRLTRENEDRVQEKNHAMLQYYQLQTRSHFFLNCLKSIYSMTSKGETEKTKRMIMLFSAHMRYIFHDTLSLVTLQQELVEVRDYYQIIQLDRDYPVLLDVHVPEELEDCRVPPLTIQTFIENSYKYNNEGDRLLRFLIQADSITMDDKKYLRLRLSDNGKGYSQEVLENLSKPGEIFGRYHVGINNLRRRIGILFDGDYEMAFFNNSGGGAVTVIYLPLQRGETEQA